MPRLLPLLLLCARLCAQTPEFPIGVWLSDPRDTYAGKQVAEHFSDLGFNHWMGIYLWPDETIRYPGFNLHAAQALDDHGFVCYAGRDQSAVDWLVDNPQYQNVFVGLLLGDEPDMTKQWNPEHHPDTWLAHSNAMRAALDAEGLTSHGMWANFGKGFAKIPWNGYQAFPGPTIQDDHDKFLANLTLASVDLYGLTDAYEHPSYSGVWTYGRSIENTRHYVDASPNAGIPVWGFVECGNPFPQTGGMYDVMPPTLLPACVWIQVIAGADGMIYFPQHMTPPSTGLYPLQDPLCRLAVEATNASLHHYADVLAEPKQAVQVWTTGPVGVRATMRTHQGARFVFAIGDGDTAHPHGAATVATLAAGADPLQEVVVLGEGRTIQPTDDGAFADAFGPYQMHVYLVP